MKEVIRMTFGSHLYGTSTPESDTDIRGIFLPSKEDILLGHIPNTMGEHSGKPNSKNTSDDKDVDMYSLHHFLRMALVGDTNAMDMLHAPPDMWILTRDTILMTDYSYQDVVWKVNAIDHTTIYNREQGLASDIPVYPQIWKDIVRERHRFYSKDMRAFISYARKQAAKYGIKASRMHTVQIVLGFLHTQSHVRLSDIWDTLPTGEHIDKGVLDGNNTPIFYEVVDRKLQSTIMVEEAIHILTKVWDNYGERVRKAQTNEDIDWKSLSHALRAAYQVREVLTSGTITFPLKEAAVVRFVKAGLMDFKDEYEPLLKVLMDEVEELAAQSTLPTTVDRNYWDEFIIRTLEEYVL